MSTLKVDGIRSNSASSDAITLASDGTCTANITNRSNRNLIINGAMQVAQYGSSSTEDGYNTCDRFRYDISGTDENPTQAQVDVASGTTPYTLGFRKAFKITNGNQGFGSTSAESDYLIVTYKTEAQDLASSGWNYLSASSNITLSFWVKSSVAQNFYFRLQTKDGGSTYNYPMETGSLSANTWTKITKTIPGNSNLQIDNDSGEGPKIEWSMFRGTNHTASSVTLNQWAGYADGTMTPDQTSTWYTTNDATWEITGVQLEVSDHATSFEHRSYNEDLALCQRYFYMHAFGINVFSPDSTCMGTATRYSDTAFFGPIFFPVRMRTTPSFVKSLGTDRLLFYANGASQGFNDLATQDMGINSCIVNYYDSLNSSYHSGWVQLNNNSAYVGFSAEL